MLLFFLIALSILSSTTTYAQQANSKQSVGFYLNYLQNFDEISSATTTGQGRRILSLNSSPRVYLGFGFTSATAKNWFNEYCIIGLHYRKEEATIFSHMEDIAEPISGKTQHTMDLMLRWEKGKYFIQSKNLHVGCSMGVSPQIYYSKINPKVSSFFPFSIFQINNRLNLTPRLKININERLAIVTKIPLEFMTLTWAYTYYDNPAQTLDERRKNDITLDIGLRSQINLGVNLSLGRLDKK